MRCLSVLCNLTHDWRGFSQLDFPKPMFGTDTYRDLFAALPERLTAFWSNWRAPNAPDVVTVVDHGPESMTLDRQWSKLEDHLQLEIARAQAVLDMQDTATLHLDAAHYALDRIAVELVDVMPSIAQIATVQPPRIYAASSQTFTRDTDQGQPIAA